MASCMEFSDSDKSEFEGFLGNDVTSTENALMVVPDSLESVQSFDLDTELETQSVDYLKMLVAATMRLTICWRMLIIYLKMKIAVT